VFWWMEPPPEPCAWADHALLAVAAFLAAPEQLGYPNEEP
jgi:hypothetical protein